MKLPIFTTWATTIFALTFASFVNAASAFSDFEDGTLQGWTGVAQPVSNAPAPVGITLTVSSDGNPGFSMATTDTRPFGSTLYARAPIQFTGDLSSYSGLQWDEFVPNHGNNTQHPTLAFLLGTDGTLYYNSVPVGPLDTWNSRFAPFQASDWILANGTASFETVQQNVQDLFILTETADVAPALESRVDNIALVPLPTAFILFGSALTGLGVIGCHGRATSKRKSG